MPYIGKGANGFGIRETFQYTATSNQTAFTGSDINSKTLSFDNGSLVDVLLNGITLKPTTDYNTSTTNTITLTSGASASDEVMIIVYDIFSLSDAMPKTGGTFSGAVTANSTLDMNGTELILDADADTSITADTDDRIDFKTAGSDRMKINSNGSVGIASDVTTSDLNIGAGVGSYATIQMTPGGTTTGNIIYFGDSGDADYSSITSFGSGAGENGRMRFIVGTQESLNILNNGNMATHGTNDIIKTNGHLKISNAFAFHGSTDNYSNVDGQNFHELNSSIGNEFILMLKNTNSGTDQHGLYIDHASGDTDNGTAHFMACVNTATRFQVRGNGNVQNHDNSYGSISDERIKQDITDAKSQWNDIKSIKIRNYKKKDDIRDYGDKAWSQIGVIAQELETVSPYLIEENKPSKSDILSSNEFGTLYTSDDAETKPILYEKGDDIPEGSKIGDVKTPATKVVGDVKEIKEQVKSVKYSVLYMKAIKALQEAMERIETLEAKVKALEEA